MKKVYVFDIDGTIADCAHRRHFVQTKPANWDAFNGLVSIDPPIEPVVNIAKMLYSAGFKLIFLSGRSATKQTCDDTVEWLKRVFGTDDFLLFMRPENDTRPDEVVKLEFMKTCIENRFQVVGIFDDRPKVVKMWRDNGYFVFDVNQTGKNF